MRPRPPGREPYANHSKSRRNNRARRDRAEAGWTGLHLGWNERCRGYRSCAHLVRAHRARDVLDALLPHIFERVGELVADLVADHTRDADATRLRQCLQPRRDVHPVAEDVVAIDDHVAEIDPDAEGDAPVRGYLDIAVEHCPLHLDRTANRVDDT